MSQKGPYEILLESKEDHRLNGTVEMIEEPGETTTIPAIPDTRTLRSSLGVTPKDMLDRVAGETTEGLGLEGLLSRASQSSRLTEELDRYDAVFYWRLGRDLVAARSYCEHGQWTKLLRARRITDWKWHQAKVIYTTFTDPSEIADRTLTSLLTDAGVYKADRFDKSLASEKQEAEANQGATGTSSQATEVGTGGGPPSPVSLTPGSPTEAALSVGASSMKTSTSTTTSQANTGDAKVKPEGDEGQVVAEPRTGKQEVQAEPQPATPVEGQHDARPASPPDEAAPLTADFRPPPPEFDLPPDLYEAVEWLRRAAIWLSWVAEDSMPPGGEKYLSTHRRFLEVIDGWRHCHPHPSTVARAG